MMYSTTRHRLSAPSTTSQSPPRVQMLSFVIASGVRRQTKHSRRVGFELISDGFRFLVGGHREKHMIGAGIHGMKRPATNLGVFATNFFDLGSLNFIQPNRTLRHSIAAPGFQPRLWRLVASFRLSPSTGISRQPCAVSRPGDEVGECNVHLVSSHELPCMRLASSPAFVSGMALAAGVLAITTYAATPVASAIPLNE